MQRDTDTITARTAPSASGEEAPQGPGLVILFTGGRSHLRTIPLTRSGVLLGRDSLQLLGSEDRLTSRRHLLIEPLGDGRLRFSDQHSKNGSYLDGQRLHGSAERADVHVIRIGGTIITPVAEVGPLRAHGVVSRDGVVLGPALQALHRQVERLAAAGQGVFLTGESGCGKEVLARSFHRGSGRASGPFVAVNCAAIPRDMAERLFFGARRGAYTGAATDAEGYLQAADGGTLFLDEIGELELSVQAKLLRALETREVLPLGATQPRRVDLRLCTATLRDLSAEIRAGRFREDLYFRVGRPAVTVPPLRERREEIPAQIEHALRSVPGARPPSAALIERGLLYGWPGNSRELFTEVRAAALEAQGLDSPETDAAHLRLAPQRTAVAAERESAGDPGPEALRAALTRFQGNLAQTAQHLAIPRNTLRRQLLRHQIELSTFRDRS